MTNEEIIKKATEYASSNWNIQERPNEYDNARDDFMAGAIWVLNVKFQESIAADLDNRNVIEIEADDWDRLVRETYNRPYCFQQQEGCKDRGTFELVVPSDETADDEMNDEIPEIVNSPIMGVKFEKWLERDPNLPIAGESAYRIGLWWTRNFYPDVNTVANNLYNKGLLRAGTYLINIDW